MAKTVCKILGVVLLLVGILGFTTVLDPLKLNLHLTQYHNIVHIASGVIALYFGFAGSAGGARGFCILFGLVYLALGIGGLVLGGNEVWKVLDDKLMFGRRDDAIHLVLGVIFLAGGFLGRRQG